MGLASFDGYRGQVATSGNSYTFYVDVTNCITLCTEVCFNSASGASGTVSVYGNCDNKDSYGSANLNGIDVTPSSIPFSRYGLVQTATSFSSVSTAQSVLVTVPQVGFKSCAVVVALTAGSANFDLLINGKSAAFPQL